MARFNEATRTEVGMIYVTRDSPEDVHVFMCGKPYSVTFRLPLRQALQLAESLRRAAEGEPGV